ncbi:SMP-30/gluconolactonase/LRE family protein [Sphingomonas quercus]|uniref:SMP-30/gluconolactonase/LRE family protein n=1 Tax=Sphingomonas quercus TaxID=2842451 RepID=A0ABS6BPG2_9SPHN|nr:SMP-30/gluconolactonase/LRE family protein [Sphingomonas quercus]MBU3079105.1 SMP-30/gluconolactonase/LRE family protein [Sphingomonas quercus]
MDQPLLARRAILAGVTTALASPLFAQAIASPAYGRVERLDPALDALIDPAAQAEIIMDGFNWSEGPLWVGDARGALYVSDPRANGISRWTAREGKSAWLAPSGYQADAATAGLAEPGTNGLALAPGAIIAADSGNRAIVRIDLVTRRRTVLADRFEGKRFNSPNDVVISPADGAMFFTDPPAGLAGGANSPLRELDFTGVFRLGRDGKVSLVTRDARPNGIALSPDGGTLYHTDGQIGWVAHKLDAQGRSVSQRPFIDLAAQGMRPGADGMKIDAAGNLWTSSRDGLSIINPQGRRLGIVRLDGSISNCEFGADGYLYITSVAKVARIPVKARKIPM